MRKPGDEELQTAATKALLPNAAKIKTFFQIARDLEQVRQQAGSPAFVVQGMKR